MPSSRPIAALAFAASIAALAAIAQTIPAPAPTLKVYSRETIVDVTVTDKDGKPVHGLKQSDFTIAEDGKTEPVRSFHEYAAEPIPVPPELAPHVYTNLQQPPSSSAINVLWLDFTNLAPVLAVSCCEVNPPGLTAGPTNLARALRVQRSVKQEAMKYLQEMPAGTRVAVLGTSFPGNLRILQTVTSDPALLSAAIDVFDYDTEARGQVTDHGISICSQQETRNRATIEALNQIAASLSAIKGRKNLLWFTHGIPTVSNPVQRPACLTDLSAGRDKAYGLLTAAEVTVYPIGATGVPAPGDPPDDPLSLEAVAEATGGTAFYNTNDLAASIAKAIATGSDYYTITYAPPGAGYDGRHHTINLKLNPGSAAPGVHLTYRDNYYAEDPTKALPTPGLTLVTAAAESSKAGMKAAMSRNLPTSTQILFDLKVEPSTVPPKPGDPPILGTLDPKLKKDHLTRYLVQYAIPGGQFAFAGAPGNTHQGSVELDLAAYDAKGSLVTGLSQTVSMPLSDAKYQEFIQSSFRFSQQLDLPPGPLFLRIGVLDQTSNKVGTLEIPLTVPKK